MCGDFTEGSIASQTNVGAVYTLAILRHMPMNPVHIFIENTGIQSDVFFLNG